MNNDIEKIEKQEDILSQEDNISNTQNNNTILTVDEKTEVSTVTPNTSDIVLVVDGKELNYYEETYKQQLITNAYILTSIVLIISFLVLRWLYSGFRKMFYVNF